MKLGSASESDLDTKDTNWSASVLHLIFRMEMASGCPEEDSKPQGDVNVVACPDCPVQFT